MRKIIKYIAFIVFVVVLHFIAACSPMDEYLDKFTDGKEITYTGIVYPAEIYSGKERVVFYGLLLSDPKINKMAIYWNSRTDSLIHNIQRSEGIDEIILPIPLPEGGYNFDVFTYDSEGNSSIPVNLTGTSYGDSYQATIRNRIVKEVEKEGSDVTIEWYSGDPNSPFTEINYTTIEGKEKVVRVATDEMETVLTDYKAKSGFTLQTYYLPDEISIDTFYTDLSWVAVNENVTEDYILNPGLPFVRGDEGTNKYGTLKDWQYTPNVLNQLGGTVGGWSSNGNPSGVVYMEAQNYSGPGIENGKIYQTIELPAGNYLLESLSTSSGAGGTSFLNASLVVSVGNDLPDLAELDTKALAYYNRQAQVSNQSETYSVNFTLEESTTVTLGWVASFGSSAWVQFNYIRLFFIPTE